MPSLSGITEIIGVRAVIIDVRQYLADGREIERVNDRMAASELKIQQASIKAGIAQNTAINAGKRAAADRALLTKAINDEYAAELKLRTLQQTPVNRNVTGQFIKPTPAGQLGANAPLTVQNDIAQAQKELAFQQSLRSFISKGATQTQKASEAAGAAEAVQIANTNRLLEQQTAIERQLTAAKASRIRAAASAGALVGTAAIGGIAVASITQAAKFEQELSKINVLTSATDEQTQQLGKSFLQLSTELPVSASDLAAASYKLLSSGIKDTGQALEITTGAAKAAVAGQADIKDIISATIAVLNGYPKGAITASQVNDILFAGVKEGAAEFNDFAGSIGKLIPIAAALGVPFDQLTASLAVLTNGGLNAEEAATGLRAILNDLAKDENSKQAQEALAQFGITVSDLRKKIRDEGLPQAMGELITLFNGNLAAIEPIIPNIRGMVAAFSAFQNGGKTTIGVLQNIDNSAGIVDQSFNKVRNNTANLAKLFSNQLNVALIEIGSAILPSVTKALQDLITWFQANREEIQRFIAQGLQGIIDITKDVAKGISVVYAVLASLNDVLKEIVGSSNSTKAALALIGTGLLWALPGGEIIVGLIAILTVLGEIKKFSEGGTKGALKGIASVGAGLLAGGVTTVATGNPLLGVVAGAGTTGLVANALGGGEKGKAASPESDVANRVAEVNKSLENLGKITLPGLKVNVDGVDQAAKKTAEDLKKLAEEFLKSSEAAGEVESFTTAFKKFGEITKKQADAFGFSAAQAGQVQAVDAVIRAEQRGIAEKFNYVEAVNAVSEAWRRNSAVGRQLLFDLAQASLEASQKALNDVFSRPTREVANLNVNLAQQQGNTANLALRNTPQILALQKQLDAINKQITQTNRANTLANRAAERQKRDQQAAQKAQQKAQQDQLDAIKLANLQAQIAAERQLAAIQKLIDANNKAASDLQEAFLKNNNDLQQQINKAIGQGDSATALALVDQQRAATKQYRDQSKALQKSTQDLTSQQKAAQEAEAERQRQAQLAEALAQSTQKQQDSTDNLTDSLDAAKESQDAQTQALEDSKQAIQDQIDALQGPIDLSKQQEEAIQRQIAVYEAATNILKAQGVAADKTLLTQTQQRQAAEHFTAQIAAASGQAQALAKSFYDFIPGAKDADLKFQTLNRTLDAITTKIDPGLTGTFDAALAYGELIKKATGDLATTVNDTKTQTEQSIGQISQAASEWQTAQEAILANVANAVSGASTTIDLAALRTSRALDNVAPSIANMVRNVAKQFQDALASAKRLGSIVGSKFAVGGVITKPTYGLIGEAGPEIILPLNNPQRSREIISQVPPSITATMANAKQAPAVFAPNISVTGETLDTMEVAAIRAVQAAFRDARVMSGRQGGLITTGLGPSH